jgi:hypothetical protein
MLVRVDSQNRNHRATVHVAVVHSSRDRLSSEALRPDNVDTEHSKYQVP